MDDCVKRYKQRRDERLKARTECFHSDYGVKGMKWGEHNTQEESGADRSKSRSGGDVIPFGPDDKVYQNRKQSVRSMYKNGEISQDVFGQLASDNFSDDIVTRAVEREWITPRQADKIRENDNKEIKRVESKKIDENAKRPYKLEEDVLSDVAKGIGFDKEAVRKQVQNGEYSIKELKEYADFGKKLREQKFK